MIPISGFVFPSVTHHKTSCSRGVSPCRRSGWSTGWRCSWTRRTISSGSEVNNGRISKRRPSRSATNGTPHRRCHDCSNEATRKGGSRSSVKGPTYGVTSARVFSDTNLTAPRRLTMRTASDREPGLVLAGLLDHASSRGASPTEGSGAAHRPPSFFLRVLVTSMACLSRLCSGDRLGFYGVPGTDELPGARSDGPFDLESQRLSLAT